MPRLTSTPEAIPANGPASPTMSTMAGAAPAASSTLAVKFITTPLVRHWTSGVVSRTRCSASAEKAVRSVATLLAMRHPFASPS